MSRVTCEEAWAGFNLARLEINIFIKQTKLEQIFKLVS
jgi:hypothetical protein